ncbi:lipase family protein [Nocardioides panacisoli]|uniref:Lipase family protein n=1 Tax=Nocardioides panacisoli TaxID=627624 RepID=A0ABP7HRV7_9ACTN
MRRLAPAIALLACLALLPGTASVAAVRTPVPEHDPFYVVPSDIASYADGQVVASRTIAPKAFDIPLPAQGWQLKYRTEDRAGAPTATVTTLLVPNKPWPGPGPRPLVSYQTAEDGVAGKCAPSYAFNAGPVAAASNSYPELSLIALALGRGWAVSVPDYEGPDSEFLVAAVEAKGVLDGIRAARSFAPAGVAPDAPVGVWGYSGGALASLDAAQYQPTYAPDVPLTALALGGVVADIRASIEAFSGSAFGGAIPMGINGFLRGYPDLDLMQYLNASGRRKVLATAGDCIHNAVLRYPFLRIQQIEATPGALDRAPVAAMLRENSPLYVDRIPQVPIYHYHAKLDELAPIGPARAVMRRFCSQGVVVQNVEDLLGEHLSEAGSGAPGALRFLADRFAGVAPTNDCASIPGGS